MRQLVVLILILVQAMTAICFQCPAPAITREEAVLYALENAESIRIARQNAVQTRESGRQASSFVKPRANLYGTYASLGANAPDIPIPQLEYPDRAIMAEAEFSQLLFAGGRIWRSLELEKNIYKQADRQLALGVRDIATSVKLSFDSVLFQNALMEILRDRLAQRREELEDARDLWEAGMVTGLDARQANVNVNFALEAMQTGNASQEETLIDFNLALGRSAADDSLVPEGALSDETRNLGPMVSLLYERLEREEILDLKLRESQTETARLNYEIAKGEFYPALAFVAGGRTEGESAGDMDEFWTVGVRMQWSVLDGGLIRSKAAEAGSKLAGAREDLERTKKELSGRVKKIAVDYESLKRRAQLQREAVALSKENYEDARGLYRAGTITQVDLGVFNLRYSEARFGLLEIYLLQRRLMAEAEGLLEGEGSGEQ